MYTAQGNLARSDTITEHLPMVRRAALSLRVRLPASVELDELIQAGTLGLIDAYDRYDASQGASFQTYANQRVRGAMLDELRRRDWIPRATRKASRDLDAAMHRLGNRLGRAPSERELAAELGMSMAEYHQLLYDVNNGVFELFEESGTDDSAPSQLASQVEMPTTPLQSLLADADSQALAEAITKLPQREQTLLALYYQEDLNLKEIGAVLEVSESRVCQLHSQAVRRLRAAIVA